jgi:hypothetical protein
MGFLLGVFMGFFGAFVIIGVLAYLLCSRSNNIAIAKFIDGVAQALAHSPKSPESPAPSPNGEATEKAGEDKKKK